MFRIELIPNQSDLFRFISKSVRVQTNPNSSASIWKKFLISLHASRVKIYPTQSELIRDWIWMISDQFFSPNESEVGIIRVDSDWEFSSNHSDLGFIRIGRLGLAQIEFWFGLKISDWFLINLHQTRLQTYFGLTRIEFVRIRISERIGINLIFFVMNFNPKLLSGNVQVS